MVPCVATWFLGCRQLLGRDIVFSCRENALLLCRDDDTTEVSMSRLRRIRQEVRCCNRFGFGKGFSVTIEHFRWRHSLVKAKGFCVTTEYFCVATEFGLGQGFYIATKCFYVATKYFYVATELAKVKRIYIAIEFGLG